MESDVAYVRHTDEGSGLADSSVFDERYSAHQDIPSGYSSYGLEASVISAAHHHDEEFAAPPTLATKADFPTTALHGTRSKTRISCSSEFLQNFKCMNWPYFDSLLTFDLLQS
jgi:hypothetical protein